METNYEKYFGTPEKAATTLKMLGESFGACVPCEVLHERKNCNGCPYSDSYWGCKFNDLEWLQEECE